jgi:thiol-disulfide isomerase/thioredoxin
MDLKSVSANRVSMIFPGMLFEDSDGDKKSIRDFKANYYIIDFWASWCTPCRSSIRGKLSELYREITDKNVILIGISVDEDVTQWKQALQKDKPKWPQLRDAEKSATCHEFFEIFSYPTLLLLNENYKIIFETSSDVELEAYLKKVINN